MKYLTRNTTPSVYILSGKAPKALISARGKIAAMYSNICQEKLLQQLHMSGEAILQCNICKGLQLAHY
jgi:hypothetical protein